MILMLLSMLRPRSACYSLSLLLGWFFTCSSGAIAAERIEVPIKQTVLTDGEIRYSIPIRIGDSPPIEAMLDTGSTGLRVLRAAVSALAYSISEQPSIYGFGSGVRLVGNIANATITIGSGSTGDAIPIEIATSVDCASTVLGCPASRVSAADYRIGGNGLPKQGFWAIVGINMGNADAVNPLLHMGAHAWIVLLPRPGEASAGKLVINPTPSESSGYSLFHTDEILRKLPGAGGFHDAIAACLTGAAPQKQKRICGPTLLDTGAPGFHITSGNSSDLSAWKAGTRMELAFNGDNGAELSTTFVAGAGRPSRIDTALRPNQPRTRISAGSLPYFAFSALYDAERPVIGLKPR
jgi:hypothetical protein